MAGNDFPIIDIFTIGVLKIVMKKIKKNQDFCKNNQYLATYIRDRLTCLPTTGEGIASKNASV